MGPPVPGELNKSHPLQLLSIGAEWQSEVAGGVNRYTGGLADALAGLGVSQQWVVVGNNPQAEQYQVTAAAPPTAKLLSRLGGVRRSSRELSKQADVLATHFALYAAPAVRACKALPHVCHFHGPWAAESAVEGGNRLAVLAKKWLEKKVYRSADRVVTLSKAFADVVTRDYGVSPEKLRVIPGGVDVGRWEVTADRRAAREQLGWPTDRPIVVCIRRLARRMGIENLIEAVSQLRDSQPDLLVLIGGGGPLRGELEAKIESCGLQHHVQLLGFVPEQDLPLAYRAADLSIVPTQSLEGFGLIVLESLAVGTPCLVTPVGGLPEVVDGFATDLILEGSSSDAIASGIQAALGGGLSLPTTDQCRSYVRENFAWPLIAKQVLDVYSEVVK